MSKRDQLISQIRRNMSEAEHDLMDNALAGRIDRRGFLAHGTRLGLSLPLLGTLAGAMGMGGIRPARAAGPSGGTAPRRDDDARGRDRPRDHRR